MNNRLVVFLFSERDKPRITCDYINYFRPMDRDGLGPTEAILCKLASPYYCLHWVSEIFRDLFRFISRQIMYCMGDNWICKGITICHVLMTETS